jgi:hypothetical protein
MNLNTTVHPDLERHKEVVLRSAKSRYARTHQPILLSTIGMDFSKEVAPFKTVYDIPLIDFIRSHLLQDLLFPDGRRDGPRAAVEPAPMTRIQTTISRRPAASPFPHEGLKNYPGALIIAFCIKPSEETDVYFSIQPPYRYTEIPARDPAPGPNYRLIQPYWPSRARARVGGL